jgi:cell division protein FtsW (lipid II flippase)
LQAFLDFFSYNMLIIYILVLALISFVMYISKTNNKGRNQLFVKIRKAIYVIVAIIVIIIILKIIFGLI